MGESFTIQFSSNLVRQLADDGEKLKKKTRRPKAKTPRVLQHPDTKIHEKQISKDPNTLKTPPAVGWPIQPPLYVPVLSHPQSANAELEGIRSVLQESQKVLERMEKQEGDMVKEVTQRAKELHEKEFKLPYQNPMPCLAEKNACLECYKEHIKDPLKCANLVNRFADCARMVRQQMSVSR